MIGTGKSGEQHASVDGTDRSTTMFAGCVKIYFGLGVKTIISSLIKLLKQYTTDKKS